MILIVSESYPSLLFRRTNEKNRRLYGVNVVGNESMRSMLEGGHVRGDKDKEAELVCFT